MDILLSGDVILRLEKEGEGEEDGGDLELETAQDTLTSVEEMLEGYELASDDILGGKVMKGTADQIEARLLDELMALEKVVLTFELQSLVSVFLTGTHRPTSTHLLRRMIGSTLS